MAAAAARGARRNAHPVADLVGRRLAVGVLTLLIVSVIVFGATEVLPGNAAFAVLGRSANPARLHALEAQLHLNRSVADQYWSWLSGLHVVARGCLRRRAGGSARPVSPTLPG
jgi:peptide/nickel transport system permease protein